MSAIDEYRRKLSQLAVEHMKILGEIADTEKRLSELKKEIREGYEKIDNILDMEIKDEPSEP
jgi:chromosome segregation ATPase